jgi:hypothetical protein
MSGSSKDMAYHSLEPKIFINTETDQLHKHSVIMTISFLNSLTAMRGARSSHIVGANVMGKYQLQAITTYYSNPTTWHEFLK